MEAVETRAERAVGRTAEAETNAGAMGSVEKDARRSAEDPRDQLRCGDEAGSGEDGDGHRHEPPPLVRMEARQGQDPGRDQDHPDADAEGTGRRPGEREADPGG